MRRRQPEFPCIRCGTPMSRSVRMHPRELRCPRCRYLIFDYPRIGVGVVVVKGGSVLLSRRAHPPKPGHLDIPGGFLDANESLEAGARRELREETGLRVGAARYVGAYPDRYHIRGFGHFPTLNIYYLARWRSGTPRAADDAASVEWVPIARLGRTGARLSWRHMTLVFRDVRRLTTG
jgi:ADP-ribose pyrophosphatase YjhB (NUDIX family)